MAKKSAKKPRAKKPAPKPPVATPVETSIYEGMVPMALLRDTTVYRHVISLLVDDETHVTARVTGMISGRGYNIESITGAEVDRERKLSRINIAMKGTHQVIMQVQNQLRRLVPVHVVRDLTDDGPSVERELALVKVAGVGEKRVEALRIGDIFRANVVDSGTESFVFEVVGDSDKVDAFIDLMKPLGLVEVSRTGVVAVSRGAAGIEALK